ncbi:hypothetical protein CQW23_14947 [Capsicum baccatum]|uniref:Uncharacterized protein n=1 Tax=Capsicum baccatum TaxID=33114 RepID=A0A2G2WKU8_CAPBA|nr:hypothetical protein CQW23_14947 [Capsicum baccatum]
MGNEKANIYWEAELPPNYDRVDIEISSLQSMRMRGGSLRMRRRFKKGGPQGDNNDIVTVVVMGMFVSPGEGALPHQTSQMTQPIAVAESVKQVAEVVNPPKVDIATDLFDMLSMDSPNDNGASAASVDDNSWRAFQPVEEELATKSGVAKADHRKCQSSSAIDDLFKDSSTLSSSISTSSLSDKPPKDVKNDIMNLFDKIFRDSRAFWSVILELSDDLSLLEMRLDLQESLDSTSSCQVDLLEMRLDLQESPITLRRVKLISEQNSVS